MSPETFEAACLIRTARKLTLCPEKLIERAESPFELLELTTAQPQPRLLWSGTSAGLIWSNQHLAWRMHRLQAEAKTQRAVMYATNQFLAVLCFASELACCLVGKRVVCLNQRQPTREPLTP
jgi:hypothetical protein